MLHNKKNFINRVSRFMVNDIIINITLNSQIEYWNGQKKSVSRDGLGMNPREESGTTDALQSGTFRNPINAPPNVGTNSKINVLQRKFKFYITTLLKTFAETLQLPTMSTLSQQGERSNAHVYSTD